MELVKRACIASGAGQQEDWLDWYVSRTGQQPNYSKLLEQLASTQTERRAIIQNFLEPTGEELEDGLKVPTQAHRAIASMVKSGHIRVIITTNFDRLMENALRDLGIEPTVVSSLDTLAGAEPITHTQCYILKIHGDYKDARILNTDVELGEYPPEFNALLDRIVDEFGLIVGGWSGEWDHALRAVLLRAPNRRYPTFWLARGALSERGQELVTRRQAVTVRGVDADVFFGELNLKLGTIQQSRLLNPMGIDLTIAMAKRFMAKEEHRIQLDDLVTAETKKALSHFSSTFASQVSRGDQLFTDWVKEHEAAVEPLVRLATVLGRWGTGGELNLVLDAIKGLYGEAQKSQAGYNTWVELKNYPAALVFYGYGLGLAKAGRFQVLFALFNTALVSRSDIPMLIGAELSPFYLEDSCPDQWKGFEGQEDKKTPLSNRLATFLTPRWAPSFAGISDPELLYEWFEFLCLLNFVVKDRGISQVVLENMIQFGTMRDIAFGRLSWHSATIRRFAEELSLDEHRQPLLDAGFAYGSDTYLDLFLGGLKRLGRF